MSLLNNINCEVCVLLDNNKKHHISLGHHTCIISFEVDFIEIK